MLGGTIRSRNGKKRATLQLVDAVSGVTIKRWMQEKNSDEDLTAALSNAATTTVRARANHQTPQPTANEVPDIDFVAATDKPLARDYYVAAEELRSRLNIADFDRPISLFEKAIEVDPNYGAAYAMLASACQAHWELDPTGPWLQKGNAAAKSAVRIVPTMAEAQRAQAGLLRYRGELKKALDAYLSAFELDQTSDRAAATVGNAAADLGRQTLRSDGMTKPFGANHDQVSIQSTSERPALILAKTAERKLNFATRACSDRISRIEQLGCRGWRYSMEISRARGSYVATLNVNSSEIGELQFLSAEIEFYARRFDVAERLYGDLLANSALATRYLAGAIRFLSAVGFIRCVAGDNPQGKALLEEARMLDVNDLKIAPDNPRFLYSLAATCAALGETDQALQQLQKAIAAGWIDYRSLSLDPRFDSIRQRGQYKEIFLHLTEKVKTMDAATRRIAVDIK